MITLLIVLAALVPYLFVGFCAAQHNLPASWEHARQTWGWSDHQRQDVQAGYLTMLLLWPVRLPARAIWSLAGRAADTADPEALQERMRQQERDLAERDRRIAELERELGIGRQ